MVKKAACCRCRIRLPDLFVILLTIYKCHYIIEAAKGLGDVYVLYGLFFYYITEFEN